VLTTKLKAITVSQDTTISTEEHNNPSVTIWYDSTHLVSPTRQLMPPTTYLSCTTCIFNTLWSKSWRT